MLVERGADINYVSPSSKNNVLHETAAHGHIEAVRFLLSEGMDVNAPGEDDQQALHFAAATGNDLLVQLLVESGAQTTTQVWWHKTPLHVAAGCGFPSLVELFLNLGIDPMIQYEPDRPNRTALHEAAHNGREDVVAVLLDHGCDPDFLDYMEESPLHLAVAQGSIINVRRLLDYGANIHLKSRLEGSLLHTLILDLNETRFRKRKIPAEAEERREIALLLLQRGADIYACNYRGEDALSFAVKNGNTMITKVLLEHRSKSSNMGSGNSASLCTAARRGFYEIAKLLLDHGAEPNSTPSRPTPLELAAREGHTDIVNLLTRRGAIFNEPCSKGLTPLQWAATNGRYAVVESLLQLGAEVDSNSSSGTALELAASNGHPDVVWLLIANGADCSGLGRHGFSASQIGVKGRIPAVHRVLQRIEKSNFST
jgi:ankyrin repeat protein